MTIGEALGRERNGFTLLRLALALAVVVSHGASVVTGRVDDEPLHALTGMTLGEHAVNGFFAVSGFLVTMSFCRRGIHDFALSRALRIVPGLVAAVLVVTFALGVALTTLPAASYLADPGPWTFVFGTLTTFKSNAILPGLFPANPLRMPMGTVWTLKYEVVCYAGTAALGLLGLFRRRGLALVGVGLLLVLNLALGLFPDASMATRTAARLVFLFAAGGALYLWRDRAPVSTAAAALLATLAALSVRSPAGPTLIFAAEAYGAIWLALGPLARLGIDPPWDLSYGVYLYGWPIQQALRQVWPTADIVWLLVPSLVLAVAVATLSWFAVERPALRIKARALGRRAIRTIEPAGP